MPPFDGGIYNYTEYAEWNSGCEWIGIFYPMDEYI